MGKYKFIEERVETMSSSELKIFLNILKNRSKELMSTLESVRGIKDLEAVCKSTQKLNNRVSEFDGGSFLILVVGPVKSGKSTLVNLIAHAHVSPTHFLECTVRPSIISKGQEESITRIFSVADKARKVEQFDSVIDSLRGFEKLENSYNELQELYSYVTLRFQKAYSVKLNKLSQLENRLNEETEALRGEISELSKQQNQLRQELELAKDLGVEVLGVIVV